MKPHDASPQTDPTPRAVLLKLLVDRFSLEELVELSFALNIRFDDLEGRTLSHKTMALIDWVERNGRYDQLIATAVTMRPNFEWPTAPLEPYSPSELAQKTSSGSRNIVAENSPGSVLISGDVQGSVTVGDIHIQVNKPELLIPAPPKPTALPQSTGFVGREEALTHYQAQLQGDGFAILTGMAGVGKTMLAAEIAQRQQAHFEAVFWYAFHEFDGVGGFIRAMAGFLAVHGQPELWENLERTRLNGGERTEPELLFGYLLELLRNGRYLLILDDLQFIDDDPDLTDFLVRLCLRRDVPMLNLVLTTRRIPKFLRSSKIDPLSGLSRQDCQTYLNNHNLQLTSDQFEGLYLNTDGNAQFVTLAVDALLLAHDKSELIERLAESEDIEQFLLEQVADRLDKREERVMEAVAMLLGYPGSRDVIEHLLNQDRLQKTLSQLTKRHLLKVTESEFGKAYLQHSIVQAFFYEQIGRRQKRQMHQLAGDYYKEEEVDYLLATRHYQRAKNWEQASSLIVHNLWEMINRGQAKALLKLLEERPTKSVDLTIELLLAWGQLQNLLGRQAEATATYKMALTQLEASEDVLLKAQAYRLMGELLEQTAPLKAREFLFKAIPLLENEPLMGRDELVKVLTILGTVELHVGDYKQSLDYLEKTLTLLPKIDSPQHANVFANMSGIYFSLGDSEQADSYIQRALKISQQFNDQFQTANFYINSGISKLVIGDWNGSVEDLESGLELAVKLGNEKGQSSLLVNLGIVLGYKGQYEEAKRKIEQGVKLARKNDQHYAVVMGLNVLADVNNQLNAWERSETLLAEAEQLANELEIKQALISIYSIWSECKLGQNKPKNALKLINKALPLAHELKEAYEEGMGLRVLGRILAAEGNLEEAESTFSKSIMLLQDIDQFEMMRTMMWWGITLYRHDPITAKQKLTEASTVFQKLGAMGELKKIEDILLN